MEDKCFNKHVRKMSRQSSAHFDKEVFRRSKDSDFDETASLKKCLEDLQSCGILHDDPRLRPIFE